MSSLKNKLYNYEQAPPAKTWDKIAAALDESHLSDEFPHKLYNSEVTPPAAAWEKITASLNKEEGPKVVRMQKRGFAFMRYAAAVLVIGLITLGIVKWTGSDKATSATEGLATTQEHQSIDKQTALPAEDSAVDGQERENAIVDENIAHSGATQVKPIKSRKVKDSYSDEGTTPAHDLFAYNNPPPPYSEHTPNLADRYVMLMTSNGIVRMSKKLGNIVCCVAGEEEDKDCKDQIKKWQEKLASSPVAPAPGNFMDILDLVNSLNENDL